MTGGKDGRYGFVNVHKNAPKKVKKRNKNDTGRRICWAVFTNFCKCFASY